MHPCRSLNSAPRPAVVAMDAPRSPPDSAPARRAPKRGEKGGRAQVVSVRVLPDELATLQERAQAAGLSVGGYLRSCGLGDAGPRARRAPSVNAVLLAQAVAQLNKAGSNLNQIAHALNTELLAGRMAASVNRQVLDEVRAAVALIRSAVGRDSPADSAETSADDRRGMAA